ncbi:MAG TPA: hypothetical protein VEU94_02325, partial [Terriglobales bacterium]|nr:hypothetical protein [Terriglobales bacterium]
SDHDQQKRPGGYQRVVKKTLQKLVVSRSTGLKSVRDRHDAGRHYTQRFRAIGAKHMPQPGKCSRQVSIQNKRPEAEEGCPCD